MHRTLPTAVVLLALAGCGGSDSDDDNGDGGGGRASDLAARLPADTRGAAAVDLAGVRKALDLPAGADPLQEPELVFSAGLAIGPLRAPNETPVRSAIDFGRVSAAAGGGISAPNNVNLLATDQPFAEVSEKLEADGYTEEDGVLVPPGNLEPALGNPAVAGKKGLIVLAGSGQAAKDALARKPADTPLARALDLVEGPARAALASPDGRCLKAYAASDNVKPPGGEVAIETAGPAEAEAFKLDDAVQFSTGVEFEDVEASGNTLRAGWTAAKRPPLTPVGFAFGDSPPGVFYDCPER